MAATWSWPARRNPMTACALRKNRGKRASRRVKSVATALAAGAAFCPDHKGCEVERSVFESFLTDLGGEYAERVQARKRERAPAQALIH